MLQRQRLSCLCLLPITLWKANLRRQAGEQESVSLPPSHLSSLPSSSILCLSPKQLLYSLLLSTMLLLHAVH